MKNVKTISRQSRSKNVGKRGDNKKWNNLSGSFKRKATICKSRRSRTSTEKVKMEVKKGDKIVLNKYAGTEVKYEGQDYVIVSQSDILAIVSE